MTKYTYGVLPSELDIKIKGNNFEFGRGPCKFPYVEEGSVTEKTKCFTDKTSGLELCPTKLHKNKTIKRVGVCFDLKKMECQISDSPHANNNAKKSKKRKTLGWCHPYDKPTIKSPPSKSPGENNKNVILRQETGFAPYHTNGDGNCLFHSMVGSILMKDDLGEGFLVDNIQRIEDENGIELKGKNYAEKMRSLYIHIINNTDDLTPFYFRIFSSVIYDGSYSKAARKVKKLIKPEYIQELIDKQKAQGWVEPGTAPKEAKTKTKSKKKKYRKVLRNVPGEFTRFVIENEDKDDCQYEININYNGANHYEAMGAFSQKEKYKPTHKAEKSVESSHSSNSSNSSSSSHSSNSLEHKPPMTTIGNNPDEYLFKIASHYNDLEKESDRSKPEYDLSANDLMILNRMKDEFLKIFVNPHVYTDEHMARTVCSYLKINIKMHQISQLQRYVKEPIKKPTTRKKTKKKRRRKGSMNSSSGSS